MRALYRLVVPAVLLAGGCQLGTSAKGYAPATAAGAMVTIELGSGERVEELLAVEDTALLVLRQGADPHAHRGDRIRQGAQGVVQSAESDGADPRAAATHQQVSSGVSAELESALLEVYRVAAVQRSPETCHRPARWVPRCDAGRGAGFGLRRHGSRGRRAVPRPVRRRRWIPADRPGLPQHGRAVERSARGAGGG
jgi:hypothetical protein